MAAKLAKSKTLNFKHVFTNENPGRIEDYYIIDKKVLGEGSYGQVSKGKDKNRGTIRAIKSIQTSSISNAERFEDEVAIQQSLDHPNIVRLFEVFKDAKCVYLVMELCTGGELFDRIVAEAESKDDGQAFDERGAANYMTQILGAMRYLHDKNFVHRDIKPENFLLQDKSQEAPIKVIDFGLAKAYKAGADPLMKTKAGTPYYVAPQVLKGSYTEKCDIWSCGVIAYILLCGYPPFYGDRDEDILRRVKAGKFDFPSPDWDEVSKDGKEFIQTMLTMDEATRPSAAKLLDHSWLSHADKPKGKICKNLGSQLKQFANRGKLKKLVLTLIATQLDEKHIKDLKDTFELLDKNRDGTLTMQEIEVGLKEAKVPLGSDLPSILKSLDTDGSGVVDYTEFIASCISNKHWMQDGVLWAAFRTLDKDGDGKITKSELKEIMKDESLTPEQMSMHLDKLLEEGDLDGDGEISWDEFQKMMKKKEEDVV